MNAKSKIVPPPCQNCSGKEDSIFCALNNGELEDLSDHKRYNSYKKGQEIFNEGNYPHGLYCIFEGKVKIHKLGETGKEQIVRFAKKGSLLGYRALLSEENYFASATALEDTTVCYFPKDEFLRVIRQNPKLTMQAVKLLTKDLRYAEEKVTNMAQKDVKERIAEALLMLKECYGYREDGLTINATLTRREIGNVAGTSTETTIRILSDFNQDGIIATEGKNIKILEEKRLIHTANIYD